MSKQINHNRPGIEFDFPKIVFVLMLVIFSAYGIFIARSLDAGIIPDEPAHFYFSKHYATTLGIPEDTIGTAAKGWYIQHNPFLYHWISGRVVNFVWWVYPMVNDWQLLVVLRLVSLSYSLGSILFCYLISKEIIKDKWYQILPPFLLTNTLMFVFLAGGVNYDNLAVLLCMAALYFLLRVFNRKEFLTNSMAWMILIGLSTLVKYPILPLALFMFVAWSFFVLKNRKLVFPFPQLTWKHGLLISSLIVIISGNLAIYGHNLVTYKWILPDCLDLMPKDQCELSPYAGRYRDYALDHKLSITESIQLGNPDPLKYLVNTFIPKMLDRIFGILGHKVYYPGYIFYFQLLFAWVILLGTRYWKKNTFVLISALVISIAYALVLLYLNYDSELVYGFKNFALQGRYYFPVIGLVYGLFGYSLEQIGNKTLRVITLLLTLALFFTSGPIRFLWQYNTTFSTWFIH